MPYKSTSTRRKLRVFRVISIRKNCHLCSFSHYLCIESASSLQRICNRTIKRVGIHFPYSKMCLLCLLLSLTARCSSLTAHCSSLTAHRSLLIAHFSLRTTIALPSHYHRITIVLPLHYHRTQMLV